MPPVTDHAESAAVDLARECLYRFLSAMFADPHIENRTDWLFDLESQRLAAEAAAFLRQQCSRGDTPGQLPGQPLAFGFGELPPEDLDLQPLLAALRRPPTMPRGKSPEGAGAPPKTTPSLPVGQGRGGGSEDRGRNPAEVLIAEYDRVFGLLVPRECPPYETEYHSSNDAFFRSQQLADIAGFYRAFGLEVSATTPNRPDHIGLELEFMAFLLTKRRLVANAVADQLQASERARLCQEAEHTFFAEHIAWWVPAFATGLRRKAGSGFYAALAGVLAAFVTAERRHLGLPAPGTAAHPALIERPEEQPECAACPLRV